MSDDLEIKQEERDLTKKYRPRKLVEVMGQDHVKDSLSRALQTKERQAILLTGPSGTGKTTIARVIARMVRAHPDDVLDINAAAKRGIDDMREVIERMSRPGLRKFGIRVCIMDEAHALTSDAKSILLKVIEDNPKHAWWIFCTTEGDKVWETIQNRCLRFDLKPVPDSKIEELLTTIDKLEKLGTSKDVIRLIAVKSKGSPRRALTSLSTCAGLSDTDRALELLRELSEADEQLARALLSGTFGDCMREAAKLKEINPESVRIRVSFFMTAVLSNPKSVDRHRDALRIMEAFSRPFPQQSGYPALVLAIGQCKLSK